MENRIITNPSVEDAAKLYSDFECGHNDLIALSIEDFTDNIKDASTAVTIEKSGSGPERLKQALNDIEAGFAEVASNMSLSDATKVLCLIVITEDFRMKEMDHLTNFFDNFSEDTNIIWGVSRNKNDSSDNVTVRILFSFK